MVPHPKIQKKALKNTTMRLAAILAVLSVTTSPLIAYQEPNEQVVEMMERGEQTKERLQLSPDQEEQVKPILDESRERSIAVLQSFGFGDGERPNLSIREKQKLAKSMKAIGKDTEKALKVILSKQQMKEYKQIQDENRSIMRNLLMPR